jgi:hypothetical protein
LTTQDTVTIVGALGFPIALVFGALYFVRRDVWPWWVDWSAQRAVVQDERHREYIAATNRNTEAMLTLTALLSRMDERLEDHTRRLQIIEGAARAAAAMRGS